PFSPQRPGRREGVRSGAPAPLSWETAMKIAVLGGGNGAFAAAGEMALAGHAVALWRRDRAAVEAHRAAGGTIQILDANGRHEARPRLITNDIAEAVRAAELILCPLPAPAQADIARALGPHLT